MVLSAPTVADGVRNERAAIVKTELEVNFRLASIIVSHQANAL